jgi:LysR family hydrogen peroxide-inducible transcriptional activator
MEIQQIRYFLAVADLRNFTRAAERCHVAQPSLSQQIKKLEQALGGPLFHRMGRRVVLTEQGVLLEKKARRILLEHENAVQQITDSFQNSHSISFGAIMSMAPYLIPELLADLNQTERAALLIEENFTEALIENVRQGLLDFAIMSSPIEASDLLVQVLGHEHFVAVVPRSHQLYTAGEAVSLEHLLQEPFLELSSLHCAGRQIQEICQFTSRHRNTVFRSSQIETIRKLVRIGKGVTILPKMSVAEGYGLGVMPIEGLELTREITLVQHQDRYVSKSTRKLIAHLKQLCQRFLDT